jgi:hypothetical protein
MIRMRHHSSTSLGLLALHDSDCLAKYYHFGLFACHSVERSTSSEIKNHLIKRYSYFNGNRKSFTAFIRAHYRSLFCVKPVHLFMSYFLYVQHIDNFPFKSRHPYLSYLFSVRGHNLLCILPLKSSANILTVLCQYMCTILVILLLSIL